MCSICFFNPLHPLLKMINFLLPSWVANILRQPLHANKYGDADIAALKQKLSQFIIPNPLVSIVIPAWNEEQGILHTLLSLADTKTEYATELIVVDNNSTDGTAKLLQRLGIHTLLETRQGVGHARTLGLQKAKGKYILTGDSDTLYPSGWVTAMTKALVEGSQEKVHCVHGSYSFLPGANTPRWQYSLYELMSAMVIRKKEKTQPYLNVLGFNCGFVGQKGIDVNGYDIPVQRTFRGNAGETDGPATEDGMMAMRLQEAGGKIKAVAGDGARVWTSDRRLQIDGGIFKALLLRLKKHL